MLLDHLGYPEASATVMRAIEATLASGPASAPFTPDIGGSGTTVALGQAIAAAVEKI
jgi:tartrate dehydrogenase/decarboxylase/D-malate dehydrogenase